MLQNVMKPSTMLAECGRMMCLPMKKHSFVAYEIPAAENAPMLKVRCQCSVLPKGHIVDSSDELEVLLNSQRMLSVIVFLRWDNTDILDVMLPIGPCGESFSAPVACRDT